MGRWPDDRSPAEGRRWGDRLDLGRSDAAEQLVADVEQRFADATAANPSFAGKTIAVGLGEDTAGTYVLEPTDLRARFFTDLGFVNSTRTGDVAQEQFGFLDQDVLVVMGAEKEAMLANPVFAQVPVVSENRPFTPARSPPSSTARSASAAH